MTVFTIGYEGLDTDAFISLLNKHSIETVVDVRELPVVAIHFAPPTPTCSMELWMSKRDRLLASTIRGVSRSSKRGLRPGWIVVTTWLGSDGQVDSAVRSAARETRHGTQAEAAFVARAVGATLPSRGVVSLREHASHCRIGIAPCGL